MTKDEFLRRYDHYRAPTLEAALKEIEGMEIVDGHLVEAVYFSYLAVWAIMLDTAADAIREMRLA